MSLIDVIIKAKKRAQHIMPSPFNLIKFTYPGTQVGREQAIPLVLVWLMK